MIGYTHPAALARPDGSPPSANVRVIDGFTVVELLITLALISLIASIVIPNFFSTLYTVKINRAISDIKVIEFEINRYYNDNLNLPPDLDALDMYVPFDPFGNPYIYFPFTEKNFKSQARKDKWLVPINSSYDLYSMGRDGESKKQLDNKVSLDDIVRASDGAFVGLSEDF